MKKVTIPPLNRICMLLALCFLALGIETAQAQIDFPDDTDDEIPTAPIDGFIGLGLVAGAYYGIQKLKKKK